MAKVNVHYRFRESNSWVRDTLILDRVPCVGEFIQVGQVETSGCKVLMVAHHQGFADVWGEHIQDFENEIDEIFPWQV